jgi:hypothetical protein
MSNATSGFDFLGRGRCRSEGELKEGIEALNNYGWLSILPNDFPFNHIKSLLMVKIPCISETSSKLPHTFP